MNKPSFFLLLFLAFRVMAAQPGPTLVDESWQKTAPREEIQPQFAFEPKAGRTGGPALLITADEREGLSGQWFKVVPVKGGMTYRFTAWHKAENVPTPRRSVVARVLWQDESGKQVAHDGPGVPDVLKGWKSRAEPEYPVDGESDAQGWTQVTGIYAAPAAATHARIELHLQW